MGGMKQISMQVRLRNNLLLQRRNAAGLAAKAVARGARVPFTAYSALENLRRSPRLKDGGLSTNALRLCVYWDASEEDLFPLALAQVNGKAREIKADVPQLQALSSQLRGFMLGGAAATPEDLLEIKQIGTAAERVLSPRLLAAFKARADGLTLDEVGAEVGVTRERARQLVKEAGIRVGVALGEMPPGRLREAKQFGWRG